MSDSKVDTETLKQNARQLARESRTISIISKELGISWNDVRNYMMGWLGAKVRIINRLNRLAGESDQSKREKLVTKAAGYVDFLYDAAKHLRPQVGRARKGLDR